MGIMRFELIYNLQIMKTILNLITYTVVSCRPKEIKVIT